MSYSPSPYVFDNCIHCAESLNRYVSFNFNNIEQIFTPTLKLLEEWNDKRGYKVLNKFQPEAEQNKERIEEAINSLDSSVGKCISKLSDAKSAYCECTQYLSSSSKFYSEWRGINL